MEILKTINKKEYLDILMENLKYSTKYLYGRCFTFQHHNDRKHTSVPVKGQQDQRSSLVCIQSEPEFNRKFGART